jgi:hypothetical protein
MRDQLRVEELQRLVDAALREFTEMARTEGIRKMTVADFIRLMQFYRETCIVEPKEIRVTWVESPATEPETTN